MSTSTTTISSSQEETREVVVIRPLKVVAFICGLSVLVLMIICVAASTWLDSEGFHQGLWYYCVQEKYESPLPPGIPETIGCYTSPNRDYMLATGILCAITIVWDFVATFLLAVALCTKKIGRKITLYRSAKICFFFALICCVAGLVLFAVKFALEFRLWGRRTFEFGWAFGMGWGAVVFLFGALLLLCCDRETDTVYYAEKTMDSG
ncbi:transmembrane protein 47-like isoform X2 [Paramacrobiotus metropolitanus]|nr:transmembrane protein 47-like isoform X2 [Paramacrobiotus metropolitanus]XP_055339927.1 transmembrane protein 47-like isoform X2 [Paramacrobiotus metropolitanus]XP_055339928.1 transmembrane protein 47-like isoform X2 [Paramacrobiotus metropolitanus]XP_055339929.1 transmembrane protein 47-like isoform X2 [Paramacrobiotus metropolitanus]XP_055339930.1 transmembrane protein 47-like isoform X2 [Paramacrobiotus metropolitanus]